LNRSGHEASLALLCWHPSTSLRSHEDRADLRRQLGSTHGVAFVLDAGAFALAAASIAVAVTVAPTVAPTLALSLIPSLAAAPAEPFGRGPLGRV
jgi:hypothetical protein